MNTNQTGENNVHSIYEQTNINFLNHELFQINAILLVIALQALVSFHLRREKHHRPTEKKKSNIDIIK